MSCIDELKELLKDIRSINDKTITPSAKDIAIINYDENPLTPALLSYCFHNILGFDVHYKIFEKVNYIIDFDYKGSHCNVAHKKLSFNMRIDIKYKNEIIDIFYKCKKILSSQFQKYGKTALETNDFTMENEYFRYKNKLDFLTNKIFDLQDKKIELDMKREEQISNVQNMEDFSASFNEYSHKIHINSLEEKYAIESYIDTFFSFLEHLLTLLYPFTSAFDISKSYGLSKIHNPRWTWDMKLIDVSCGNNVLLSYLEALREIKEVYRNRNAHGMFSRELKVYAQVEGFGRYPIFLGKNYLKGFIEDNPQLIISFEKFKEIKVLFDDFLLHLSEIYPVPMIFIEGGALIPVDVKLLTEGTQDLEKANDLLEEHLFMMDNQINMDW